MALTELKVLFAIKNSINGTYKTTKKCQSPRLRALGIFSSYNIRQALSNYDNVDIDNILQQLVEKNVINKLNEEELDMLRLRSHADMYCAGKPFKKHLSQTATRIAYGLAGVPDLAKE